MKILVNEKISQHKYKTPEGYLICVDSILARTGAQTYRKNELFTDGDDSEIEVGRTPEEVFAPETLASFENKPITIEHPHEDVNIENYKDYSVGFVRDVKQGEFEGQPVILGTLVITDKDAIEGIENGEHVELSCGYECDIEDGENGYQQKHIRGNHVALCQAGRAGVAKIVDSMNDAVIPEAKGEYKGYVVIAKSTGRANAPTLLEIYDGNKKVKSFFSADEDLDDAIHDVPKYWPLPPLPQKKYDMLSSYLNMISTFTSRDIDIKDVLRPLSGKGFKYTIDKIEGWIWKKGEMAYKNYYVSLDEYSDKFIVTLYADPNQNWKVNEVNAYVNDSIKDVDHKWLSEEAKALKRELGFFKEPGHRGNGNGHPHKYPFNKEVTERMNSVLQDIANGEISEKVFATFDTLIDGYKESFDMLEPEAQQNMKRALTRAKNIRERILQHLNFQNIQDETPYEEQTEKLEEDVVTFDDKFSTAKKEIIAWWKEVERWNNQAGNPFHIENDYNNAYDLWSAMYDMFTESKLKAERPDLAKQGQRIYKKWEYDFNWTFNDSVHDVEPRSGESKDEFISRFMEETKSEYPDEKQRVAVAYSYWEKAHGKDSITDAVLNNVYFDKYVNGLTNIAQKYIANPTQETLSKETAIAIQTELQKAFGKPAKLYYKKDNYKIELELLLGDREVIVVHIAAWGEHRTFITSCIADYYYGTKKTMNILNLRYHNKISDAVEDAKELSAKSIDNLDEMMNHYKRKHPQAEFGEIEKRKDYYVVKVLRDSKLNDDYSTRAPGGKIKALFETESGKKYAIVERRDDIAILGGYDTNTGKWETVMGGFTNLGSAKQAVEGYMRKWGDRPARNKTEIKGIDEIESLTDKMLPLADKMVKLRQEYEAMRKQYHQLSKKQDQIDDQDERNKFFEKNMHGLYDKWMKKSDELLEVRKQYGKLHDKFYLIGGRINRSNDVDALKLMNELEAKVKKANEVYYYITSNRYYQDPELGDSLKDSIYSLNVIGQKSRKLVRAKDAREAIEKYKKMFPKDKIKSVKKTDKFNNIIETITR